MINAPMRARASQCANPICALPYGLTPAKRRQFVEAIPPCETARAL